MRIRQFWLLVACIFLLGACSAPKRAIYLRNAEPQDSAVFVQSAQPKADVVIQSDDILAINITSETSLTPKVLPDGTVVSVDIVEIYNGGGTPYNIAPSTGQQSSSQQIKGYLVDRNGEINYSVLGRVKVGGLTLREANDAIARLVDKRVKSPVVETRIINFTVTVLGEVSRPGSVIASNQRISIFEAIAAAGDIPITGRKDNVGVVRTVNGMKQTIYLNLNSRTIFSSPFYYLQQNDIVIVEPVKVRRQETNEFIRLYLPIVTTIISTGLAIYTISTVSK